jgi:hypothetical protein
LIRLRNTGRGEHSCNHQRHSKEREASPPAAIARCAAPKARPAVLTADHRSELLFLSVASVASVTSVAQPLPYGRGSATCYFVRRSFTMP